jgi:hypothetical protein
MIIDDLLVWGDRRSLTASPEMDALSEPDTLLDATLLDVDIKLGATMSVVCLVFDCRGAVQLEIGNTAVVAVHEITSIRWRAEPSRSRMWLAVTAWRPTVSGGQLSIDADLSSGARLHVVGTAAEFYVGDIPGRDESHTLLLPKPVDSTVTRVSNLLLDVVDEQC